jgi:hypothetical protein
MNTIFMKKFSILHVALVTVAIQSSSYGALTVNSVNWTTGGRPALGVLEGTNNISFSTAAHNNSGQLFTFDWGSMPFAAGYDTTSDSAVAMGYTTGTSTTTVSFSQSINSLALWFNYIDSGTTFNFTGLNWSFVAGNNASRSGSTVVSTGGNSPNDGFLINVDGSFGPSAALSFTVDYAGAGSGDTAGFTLSSAAPVAPIPEPGTWAAMAIFAGGAAFAGWRRRKSAKVAA